MSDAIQVKSSAKAVGALNHRAPPPASASQVLGKGMHHHAQPYLIKKCLGSLAYLYVWAGVCSIHGCQKRTSDPLGMELVVFVSWLMWVVGTEPVSSGRAVSALNL